MCFFVLISFKLFCVFLRRTSLVAGQIFLSIVIWFLLFVNVYFSENHTFLKKASRNDCRNWSTANKCWKESIKRVCEYRGILNLDSFPKESLGVRWGHGAPRNTESSVANRVRHWRQFWNSQFHLSKNLIYAHKT